MNLEQEIFNIILHAGNARGLAYEALEATETFDFDRADQLLKQAEEELEKAHETQTKLIQAEMNGTTFEKSLLLIHAQDHLMTAVSEQKLIERMIRVIKKLKESR
ncbi:MULTISPECIES: PTS lactose/cellobiose transporter subunit IIA [Thermoactinomyces]|nr:MULTISPECIES: PTS lactose/cellobiose transporter subunit IIA [Thermoactinomyces]MBH8599721.1 PTS lactose/cellobiose transporter subunit IIA [Thermoactinomyces sp. CICC 10523]MBH8605893.1 PTS lactose/cellobiose transporter subunit IIA [Thermoactinomyces sp. CICC 10522]MBH8609308.1 PTS lactose/cellobiose transporter subunit IIA [Thermoactinomyces sp. CICC 10521]